jgi:hypothetical protein
MIPPIDLINEFKEYGFKVYSEVPRVHCKAFEDNSGALELARRPKLRPRTKHINIKYHHFREHVRLGLIKVYPIGTKQWSDYQHFHKATCTESISEVLQEATSLLGLHIDLYWMRECDNIYV